MTPAQRAAARYREFRVLGRYAKSKAALDPAYPAVAEALRGSPRPLLDIGCGVGLLAAFLRESGCSQPILGIEPDAEKVRLGASRVAAHYASVEFRVGDALRMPAFSGDIVMLDVLHYMGPGAQQAALEQIASRVAPGGRALIRTAFRDGSWRYYATLLEEAFVRVSGWIRGGCCRFPTQSEATAPFGGPEWEVTVKPMWGRTPFNSHLIAARRRPGGDSARGRGQR